MGQQRYLDQIKLVSFDIWNTLLESNPEYKAKRTALLQELLGAKKLTLTEMGKVVELADDQIDERSRMDGRQYGIRERIFGVYNCLPADKRLDELTEIAIEQFEARSIDLIAENLPKVIEEDLLQTLQKLKARGIEMAVVSNTGFIDGKHMRVVLEKLGILPFLRVQIFSNEVGVSKPDQKIFEALLKQTGYTAKEVLHIGDDKVADCEGAIAANIKALHLTNNADDSNSLKKIRDLVN